MRFGFLSGCFDDVSLPEVVRWAGQAGFSCLEVGVSRTGSNGWYAGSLLNPPALDTEAREALAAALRSADVSIGALTYCDNMLEPDETRRAAKWQRLSATVDAASRLNVPVVNIFVGRDPGKKLGECIAEFSRLAGPVAKKAEEAGVRLAIENCPMPGWQFEHMPGNVAFAPQLWEKIFTHLPSAAVGLCFDPSHLVWLGVDPVAAATDYIEKIFYVHAKDTEVFPDRRNDCSVLQPRGGWWRYRVPGLGQIDWRRLLDRLGELGYDGDISIEHEDPVWSGSLEKVKAGLALGLRHLQQFVP